MPPKRRSNLPKPYGRQAEGKTIKSLSLDAELVAWSEGQAERDGMSFSSWMNEVLRREKSARRGKAPKAAPAKKAKTKAKKKR
jgi:hypothetical protein